MIAWLIKTNGNKDVALATDCDAAVSFKKELMPWLGDTFYTCMFLTPDKCKTIGIEDWEGCISTGKVKIL